jgi:hypothetical protein
MNNSHLLRTEFRLHMLTKKTENRTADQMEQLTTGLPDWLQFPTLGKVFEGSPSSVIEKLEAKRQALQVITSGASGRDQIRARLAAASYVHACALLRELQASIAKAASAKAQPLPTKSR